MLSSDYLDNWPLLCAISFFLTEIDMWYSIFLFWHDLNSIADSFLVSSLNIQQWVSGYDMTTHWQFPHLLCLWLKCHGLARNKILLTVPDQYEPYHNNHNDSWYWSCSASAHWCWQTLATYADHTKATYIMYKKSVIFISQLTHMYVLLNFAGKPKWYYLRFCHPNRLNSIKPSSYIQPIFFINASICFDD